MSGVNAANPNSAAAGAGEPTTPEEPYREIELPGDYDFLGQTEVPISPLAGKMSVEAIDKLRPYGILPETLDRWFAEESKRPRAPQSALQFTELLSEPHEPDGSNSARYGFLSSLNGDASLILDREIQGLRSHIGQGIPMVRQYGVMTHLLNAISDGRFLVVRLADGKVVEGAGGSLELTAPELIAALTGVRGDAFPPHESIAPRDVRRAMFEAVDEDYRSDAFGLSLQISLKRRIGRNLIAQLFGSTPIDPVSRRTFYAATLGRTARDVVNFLQVGSRGYDPVYLDTVDKLRLMLHRGGLSTQVDLEQVRPTPLERVALFGPLFWKLTAQQQELLTLVDGLSLPEQEVIQTLTGASNAPDTAAYAAGLADDLKRGREIVAQYRKHPEVLQIGLKARSPNDFSLAFRDPSTFFEVAARSESTGFDQAAFEKMLMSAKSKPAQPQKLPLPRLKLLSAIDPYWPFNEARPIEAPRQVYLRYLLGRHYWDFTDAERLAIWFTRYSHYSQEEIARYLHLDPRQMAEANREFDVVVSRTP